MTLQPVHPPLNLHVQLLPHAQDMGLPSYGTEEAAGLDLMAAVSEPVVLEPGARALIPTGIAMALPQGYEAQVRPRSGLALKHGLTTLNTPGTIDSDYRGEIGVILINHGQEAYEITRGMRIAQMVINTYVTIAWQPVVSLPVSVRGTGGFGSTGVGHPLQRPQEKASDQ